MKAVIQVVVKALVTLYENLFFLMNVGSLSLLAVILILPGPFALAGLFHIARRALEGRGLTWQHFWESVRQNGPRLWPAYGLLTLGFIVIIADLVFYNGPQSPLSFSLRIVANWFWGFLGLVWTGLSFYLPGVLMTPEKPTFKQAFTTSAVLAIRYPLQTFAWILSLGIFLVLTAVVPVLLVFFPVLVALISTGATCALLGIKLDLPQDL